MNTIQLIMKIRQKYNKEVNINELSNYNHDELVLILKDLRHHTKKDIRTKTSKKICIDDFSTYIEDCINI